ncbi:MAG: extracellular solute-binding protein [Oscillospiraceae bacterium]|nr:extracellular solute-binding protein [Oscillospiraceae bacterium]
MKKRIALMAAAGMAALALSSCSHSSSAAVTVYIVDTEALYVDALKACQKDYPKISLTVATFESYDKLNSKLNTDMRSGEGPDLLLYNSLYSGIDPMKLAENGTFLPLDSHTRSLEQTVLLESGVYDETQYFLPLSWNILQGYSTERFMTEQGYDQTDLYTALVRESERLAEDGGIAPCTLQFFRTDALNFMLETAGVDLFEGDRVRADKTEVQEVAGFVKMFYDNMDKIGSIAKRYNNDLAGAASHFSFLLENFSFMNNLRYYQSVYPNLLGETMVFMPFDHLTDEGMTAQIIQYGAINANTKQEDAAWKVLKYLYDYPSTMLFAKYDIEAACYAPVNPDSFDSCLHELTTFEGQGPGKKTDRLSEENAEVLWQISAGITRAVIPNPAVGAIVQDCMKPYLTGAVDFDGCYDALIEKLELYLAK